MFNTCKSHAKLGGDAKPKSIAKFKDFLDSTKRGSGTEVLQWGPRRGKASLGDLGTTPQSTKANKYYASVSCHRSLKTKGQNENESHHYQSAIILNVKL